MPEFIIPDNVIIIGSFLLGVGIVVAVVYLIKFLHDDANKPKQSKSSFINRINNSSYKRIFNK